MFEVLQIYKTFCSLKFKIKFTEEKLLPGKILWRWEDSAAEGDMPGALRKESVSAGEI